MKIRVWMDEKRDWTTSLTMEWDYWSYEVLDESDNVLASRYHYWGTEGSTIRAAKRARRLAKRGIFLGEQK